MTPEQIADLAETEKAKTAKANVKLIRLTAADSGIAEAALDDFMRARGDRYEVGADSIPRHIKSGKPMADQLAKLKEKKPFYWAETKAAAKKAEDDAPPTGADNPWSIESGFNVTAQGAYLKEHGEAKARAAAAAVGSKIGATKPPASATGKGANSDTEIGKTNPWSPNYRGTDAEARRLSIIKSSTHMASNLARAAGVDLAGRPLRKTA